VSEAATLPIADGVELVKNVLIPMRDGLHLAAWYNHFIIAPPLTITPEEIDEGVGIFDDALAAADTEAGRTE